MADTFSIGLPNQGLKSLTSTFTQSAPTVIPFEYDGNSKNTVTGVDADLTIATTRNLLPTVTVPANAKLVVDSLLVDVPIADAIVKMYRSGTLVASWTPKTITTSIQLFPVGGGKELDETETLRITVVSATGIAAMAHVSVSGRYEMKRGELFTQVIA
jgi:hypothetical protein